MQVFFYEPRDRRQRHSDVMNHVHLCMVTLGWAGVTAKPGGRLAEGGGGGGGGGAGSSEISLS
jgi:hypothetical protein